MQFSSSYRTLINRKYNDILRINPSQVSKDLFNSLPKDLYKTAQSTPSESLIQSGGECALFL